MEQIIGAGGAGGAKKKIAEHCLRSPTFFVPQGRAQGLACQVKAAALIAVNIAPTAGARLDAAAVTSKDHRARAGDCNDPRFARDGPRQRDGGVVRNDELVRADERACVIFFVRRPAAEAEACRSKSGGRGIE